VLKTKGETKMFTQSELAAIKAQAAVDPASVRAMFAEMIAVPGLDDTQRDLIKLLGKVLTNDGARKELAGIAYDALRAA
jgi:hypothetical protein